MDDIKEKETIFIKDIITEWADYITTKNIFDTSTKESFEVKKRYIQNIGFKKLIKKDVFKYIFFSVNYCK